MSHISDGLSGAGQYRGAPPHTPATLRRGWGHRSWVRVRREWRWWWVAVRPPHWTAPGGQHTAWRWDRRLGCRAERFIRSWPGWSERGSWRASGRTLKSTRPLTLGGRVGGATGSPPMERSRRGWLWLLRTNVSKRAPANSLGALSPAPERTVRDERGLAHRAGLANTLGRRRGGDYRVPGEGDGALQPARQRRHDADLAVNWWETPLPGLQKAVEKRMWTVHREVAVSVLGSRLSLGSGVVLALRP